MNDFTKEELKSLQRAIIPWFGKYAGQVIKNKIQSMIDNYCDHEFDRYGCQDCSAQWCSKCKKGRVDTL